MNSVIEAVTRALGVQPETTSKIIASALTVLGILVVRWIVLRVVSRRSGRTDLQYRWRKGSAYASAAIGAVVLGRVWFAGVQSLVTYLGLVSAGIAIALRDPIVNLFGWIFITSRRPFVLGDRISVAGSSGDVIDIGVSMFSLLETAGPESGEQASGRIVHVPNGVVFGHAVANYTQGFNYVWNEIPVVVTFESDWEAAKGILEAIASEVATDASIEADRWIREAGKRFLLRRDAVEPAVYSRIVADGVELTIRHLCEARQRRATTQEISERILQAFAGAGDIDFAYKTSRIFRQSEEGKRILKDRTLNPDGPQRFDEPSRPS